MPVNLTYVAIILSSVFLLLVFIYLVMRKSRRIKQKQALGLNFILQLKNLITSMQKHRGWSAAYARGDKSVHNDLTQLKHELARLSQQIESKFPAQKFERWMSHQDHWGRLARTSDTLDLESCVKQHTQLIGNLLYLLEDIAEHYHLTAEHLLDFPNISLLWRELLQVSEYIGQSRALGTGVATEKSCSSVEKIKLGFLQQKINEVSKITFIQLLDSKGKNVSGDIEYKVNTAAKQTQDFCQIIKQELIDAESVTLDAKQYFALATKSIEVVNEIFDSEVKQIQAYFAAR